MQILKQSRRVVKWFKWIIHPNGSLCFWNMRQGQWYHFSYVKKRWLFTKYYLDGSRVPFRAWCKALILQNLQKGDKMGDPMTKPVQVSVSCKVLRDLMQEVRFILEPEARYTPDNETYLKSVISGQRDRAGKINTILTNILYPN